MFWFIVAFVVSLVVSYSLMPKVQNPAAATLNELKVPTAEVGRDIPVLFGERDINSPNVVWYGDFRAVPIHAKGGKK